MALLRRKPRNRHVCQSPLIHRFVSFLFFRGTAPRYDTIGGSLWLSVTRQPYDYASVSSDHRFVACVTRHLIYQFDLCFRPVAQEIRCVLDHARPRLPQTCSSLSSCSRPTGTSRASCFLFSLSCLANQLRLGTPTIRRQGKSLWKTIDS